MRGTFLSRSFHSSAFPSGTEITRTTASSRARVKSGTNPSVWRNPSACAALTAPLNKIWSCVPGGCGVVKVLLLFPYRIASGIASIMSVATKDSPNFFPAIWPALPLMYAAPAPAFMGETPRASKAHAIPAIVSPAPPTLKKGDPV